MYGLLTVMLGGAVGAGGRFALGSALSLRLGNEFPWGTLVVNLIGGLAMGLLAGALGARAGGEPLRLLLGVGVLGGFTTFSAFSLDAVRLLESGQTGAALGYIAASVMGSIMLTWAGLVLVRST